MSCSRSSVIRKVGTEMLKASTGGVDVLSATA
jgi:hypothetical protein